MSYFHSLIIAASKGSPKARPTYVEKMRSDEAYLADQFDGLLFKSVLLKILQPFEMITQFIESESAISSCDCVVKIRQHFGPGFTVKSLKSLINLVGGPDLKKKDKTDI